MSNSGSGLKSFLTEQRREELKAFVDLLRAQPHILHSPELSFLRDYLLSLGATIPPPPAQPEPEKPAQAQAQAQAQPTPAAAAAPAPEKVVPPQQAEPVPELPKDTELMEPDAEVAEGPEEGEKGKREVTEEDVDAANELRGKAMGAGNDEEAVGLLTQAIGRNPKSSILYATRASVLLRMRRPNAAVRDCTRAIALNPDSAKPYKVRGRALRHLGRYAEAKPDLITGNKLDYDDATNEVYRFVETRVHHESQARRSSAAKKPQTQTQQPQREEPAPAAAAASGAGMGGELPPGIGELFNDPEVLAAIQDPGTQAKLLEVLSTRDPAKILEASKDPKLGKVIAKLMKTMGTASGKAPQ